MIEKGKRLEKTRAYLTPNEVAELLMVSPVTVRQWAQKGTLKALTTPGGHRRFLCSEVERFARQHGMILPPDCDPALRILVVDDDKQFVRYLLELLDGLPEEIVSDSAYDGFDAGRKVHVFQPHVVLLDLMMPGLDGFDVCRRLKDDAATKAVRIIAMTGYYAWENVNRIVNAGAEACLPKPLDPEALLEAIGLRPCISQPAADN